MDMIILVLTVAGVVAGLGALIPNSKPKLRLTAAVAGALLLCAAAAIYVINGISKEEGKIKRSGDGVQSCKRFNGSVELPDDRTVVLANKNLSNNDVNRYVRLPIGWERPAKLEEWSVVQYFGIGKSNVGQKFQVDLIAVDLAIVKMYEEAFRKTGSLSGEESERLLQEGKENTLDTIYLHRINGDTPDKCES